MYTASEWKKPKSQQTGKASAIDLTSDVSWADFREEMKMQIRKLYSQPIIVDNLQNFQISYTIPRTTNGFLILETQCDYGHLMNIVKKGATVKVRVIEQSKTRVSHVIS